MRLSHNQRQIPVTAPTVDVRLNRKRLLHMTSYPLLLRSSPHHAQQDWRLFPIQARQQQNQKRHPLKHHPHWTRIQAAKNRQAMCAPFIQCTGQSLLVRCFHFLGAIRLSPLPPLLPFYLSPTIPRSAFFAIIKSAGSRLIQLDIIEPWISAKIACALGTLSSSEKPNRTR